MKVWLITWEWAGDYAKVENPIAAILNPRLSPKRVSEIIELLYVNRNYSLSERLDYSNNKKFNPYPAEYYKINGVDYLDRIYCGHMPYLYARKVKDIKVVTNQNGKEELIWKELPKPKINL
jgi:hypothetical protein